MMNFCWQQQEEQIQRIRGLKSWNKYLEKKVTAAVVLDLPNTPVGRISSKDVASLTSPGPVNILHS